MNLRRVAIVFITCIAVSACGISPDPHPRDIDPERQELLLLPTTSVATTDTSNP